eukprot:1219765-Prymnesium_polylepis.1
MSQSSRNVLRKQLMTPLLMPGSALAEDAESEDSFAAWRDVLVDMLRAGAKESGTTESVYVQKGAHPQTTQPLPPLPFLSLLADAKLVIRDEEKIAAAAPAPEPSAEGGNDSFTRSTVNGERKQRTMLRPSVRDARRGGLIHWAWLLNNLLPETHAPLEFEQPPDAEATATGASRDPSESSREDAARHGAAALADGNVTGSEGRSLVVAHRADRCTGVPLQPSGLRPH